MNDFNRGFAAFALSLAGAIAACGDEANDSRANTGEDAAVPTTDAGPVDRGRTISWRIELTVPGVPPGTEGTKCAQLRLGNDERVHIRKVHNQLLGHSHHFIVSTVTDPEATERSPFDCTPFRAPMTGAPLTVTQKHDEEIVLPDGVGYALEEDQLMHLELHYINTSSETADVRAVTELFRAEGDGAIQEAGFLIVGTMNIEIPPHSSHTTGDLFIGAPPELGDARFYAFTGHTHRFGTRATMGVAASATAEPELVYEPASFDWSSPEVKYLDPPVQLPSGGGFRFRCEWENPTDETIRYGESALTEMCFFWGYYYPKLPKQQTLIMRPMPSMK